MPVSDLLSAPSDARRTTPLVAVARPQGGDFGAIGGQIISNYKMCKTDPASLRWRP
jgi:hypothetical protein